MVESLACNECLHMRLNLLEALSPQIHMSEEKRLAVLKPLESILEFS
mgnify:CR=1 FL=1